MLVVARLARTGYQDYPEGREYRDAAEVFHPDSLATWLGAPVTIGHVDTISRGNVAALAVGYVRSVKRDGDHVLGELVITDASAIAAIESGRLAEVSAGYTTHLVDGRQTEIRINHVALGARGWARCGSTCAIES